MSKRNIGRPNVKIPDNPEWIEFKRSDGDSKTWPTNTKRIVNSDREVNFMEIIPIDHPSAIKWRQEVGQYIAKDNALPNAENAILKDWPAGYRMFDHHKGIDGGNIRHDLYLYGSVSKKFRSIKEFIPHALWLFRNTELNPIVCLCKYCTKRAQREISAVIERAAAAPPPEAGPSGTQAPQTSSIYAQLQKDAQRAHKINAMAAKARREPAQRVPKEKVKNFFAGVREKYKPAKVSLNVLKQPVLAERHSDLRAVYSNAANKKEGTESGQRRWHRTAEIVWVHLPKNGISFATSPETEGPAVGYWPAIVEHGDVKTERISNGSEPPSWTIKQRYVYRVRLLGVDVRLDLDDNQVLPYLAHAIPLDVFDKLPIDFVNFDREAVAAFNPVRMAQEQGDVKGKGKAPMSVDGDDQRPQTISEAATAYALAVQTAAVAATYWTLTDRFEFNYIPNRKPPASSSSLPQPAIATMQAEENGVDHYTHHNVTTLNPNATVEDSRTAADAALGVPSISVAGAIGSRRSDGAAGVVQVRYQGLYWGAERIWVDDIVRLNVSRGAVAPDGTPQVLPPSGPGKKGRELMKQAEMLAANKEKLQAMAAEAGTLDEEIEGVLRQLKSGRKPLGANERGVFMRIDSFFSVPAQGNRNVKELRVSGILYELADEDYEEGDDEEYKRQFTATVNTSMLPPPVPPANPPPPQVSTPGQYPPPQPPYRFRFRPILKEGYEVVISASLIAGRYYPRICRHPLIAGPLQEALESGQHRDDFVALWALEGLWAGHTNAIEPLEQKKTRSSAIEDADRMATRTLENYNQELDEFANDGGSSLLGTREDGTSSNGSQVGSLNPALLENAMDVD